MDKDILECIEKNSNFFIDIRRELHQYPELGFELPKTTEIIEKYLNEFGIEYRNKIGVSGIIADIKGKDQTITIGLRADMDALPIEEKTGTSYCSKNSGNMHACGHDAHTAILLGVAKILSSKKEFLPCNVRLIFQPAEETTGGAAPMIEDKALDGVDCIFGLHVDEDLECGKIGIKYGAVNASSTDVKIEVAGKSCHGAYPSDGVDAIVTMAAIIMGIQTVISRNTDAREAVVINLGKISGGTKENIVPQNVLCTGTMRILSEDVKAKTKSRLKDMVEYTAKAYGGSGKITFKDSYIALINNDEFVDIVKENTISLLGMKNLEVKKLANMGVEDFAYYVDKIPGAFFTLGTRNEKKGIVHPAHNDKFDIDEDALKIGVEMQILNIFAAYKKLKKGQK